MKILKVLLLSTVASQLLFSSCKKTNDVSADASTAVDYQLKVSNPIVAINQRVEAGNIRWTSGFGSPILIKFEAKKSGAEVEFKSKSTQRIDLFAPTNSLGNVALPSGTYDEVEFKIQLDKSGTTPALELTGTYAASNGNIPVVLRVNDLLEIKAEQTNVSITAKSSNTALTTIDLAKLTAGITQSMLGGAQLTNGSIIISSTSNPNLYNAIISNLNQFHSCDFQHH